MLKIAILLLSAAATSSVSAQVYESVDAQGNPVYSDRPSADGQAVEIPAPNLGDAVEVPPAPPAPAPEARPAIEPDREAGDVDGELIGEKERKKKKRNKTPPRPTPRGGG